MSGGSSSPSGPSEPGGPQVPEGEPGDGPGIDCARLFLETILSSPNPAVIANLNEGERLPLELRGERGPVVAVAPDGQVAGSITAAALADLVECIQQGFDYVAVVLSVDGGACRVQVRPR